MELLYIFKKVSIFWFCFICIKITICNASVFNGNDSFKHFSCSVFRNLQDSQVSCAVSFLYSIKYTEISDCIQDSNDVLISVGMDIFDPDFALRNVSFVCTSKNHLSLKVEFSGGDPKTQYMEMRPEKFIQTPLHENYRLHFLFPQSPEFINDHGQVVKYSIFHSEDPASKLNMFVEFYPIHKFVDLPPACRAYSLQGNSRINVMQEEVIAIPCLHFNQTDNNSGESSRLVRNGKVLLVDNVKVFYDKWKGFLLNATQFDGGVQGNYTCMVTGCANYTFQLSNSVNWPKSSELYLYGPKFSLMLGRKESLGAVLFCSALSETIDLQLDNYIFHPNSTVHNIAKYISSSFGKETPRNMITGQIPYLSATEREEYSGWIINEFDGSDLLFYFCDVGDSRKMFWTVRYDPKDIPFYYSHDHKAFICEEEPSEMFGPETFMVVYHWECKNVMHCEIVLSHCVNKGDAITDEYTCVSESVGIYHEKENSCLKSLQTNLVPCVDVDKEDTHTKLCKAIRPSKKGIVQCSARLGTYNNFRIHYLYFEGFDNNIYVDVDLNEKPPLNAILKLTSFNKEEYFWTGDNFNFRCEAHSFLYADGIRWFFKYENGSVLIPPSDAIVILQTEKQEKYNPESNIKLYFEDTTVIQVICSAPLLHSYEWDNISINISVFDWLPPKITSETIFYLKEIFNGTDQLLPCQAFGIPEPDIFWTKSGKEIEDPLTILLGHILVFPYYDELFLGEYTCTAKSIAGDVSDNFIVLKAVDSDGTQKFILYYTLAGLGTLTIFIVAVIIFIFSRMQKEKRRKKMEEIVNLVEGVESKELNEYTIDKNTDALQMPFKKNYEIQKDDFKINWNCRLGSGQFGEVYQGTLNHIKGPIAIKMLKQNAKIEHLKALASELKILMFVGEHDNLVTLYGAYKQELEKGILYVAVEFCGLGSLESYLHLNKHLFLKCPLLRRLSGDASWNQTISVTSALPPAHSFATLLKWCQQITSGMDFLGSKYVVHADLAARNVLLTSEGNVKVTDFGLSRRMYNYLEYVKKSDEPIPWQWIAPESILLQKYSSKSDVWAYGITIWEIFTFGESPYPTFSFNQEFLAMLQIGGRNKPPKYAPKSIYKIMQQCWEYDPDKRPSFSSLHSELSQLIDCPIALNIEVQVEVQNPAGNVDLSPDNFQYVTLGSQFHPFIGNVYRKIDDVRTLQ